MNKRGSKRGYWGGPLVSSDKRATVIVPSWAPLNTLWESSDGVLYAVLPNKLGGRGGARRVPDEHAERLRSGAVRP